jgi:hypothetical protein
MCVCVCVCVCVCAEISNEVLSPAVTEAEKSHDLPSASWWLRESSDVSGSKAWELGGPVV